MKQISMLAFRRDASRALRAVARGERLILTFRGKPIARLEPIGPASTTPDRNDPVFRIDEFAVDGPGTSLGNAEIDRVVYGG